LSSTEEIEALVSEPKFLEWIGKFSVYRQPPQRQDIVKWLSRFDAPHLTIAIKLLDAVIIRSELQIQECYRNALEQMPGWTKETRQGRWFFVGAGNAGESGQAMLRSFREANGLTQDRWQSFFVAMRELPNLRLSARDTLVFVDDFAGSGKQMCDYWPTMQELIASEAKCYLVLTATTAWAAARIAKDTELELIACLTLDESANIFSVASTLLSEQERAAVVAYGEIAWPAHPKGFGDAGLLLILSHKTPNNSIPLLHANHGDWKGLFPRNLLPA
jgi:hypothetical protein